jgi:hypothetical protein
MAAPASLPRFPQPGTGLILFQGNAACLTVGLLVGLRAATPDHPLLVVDGANSLDPYLLADLARRLKQPPATLLASVFISRLFTAYQLEAAIVDRLRGAIDARRPSGVLLAGLLDLLHDEDFDATEARRIFARILGVIRRLAAGPRPVIATCPSAPPLAGREAFLPRLATAAAWVFAVTERDGTVEITAEKPARGRWRWEPETALLSARRFY